VTPPVAGTIGVYIRDPVDAGSKYALTAGHLGRANPAYNNVGINAIMRPKDPSVLLVREP